MDKTQNSASVIIKVPFHDVDSAQIVWHGNYAKYLEVARCELFDQIAYNYQEMLDSGYVWPVIDMRIRYAGAIKFRQKIRVEVSVAEWEHRLKLDYAIYCNETNKRLTKAYTVQVAVEMSSGEMQLVSPLILAEKLGLAV